MADLSEAQMAEARQLAVDIGVPLVDACEIIAVADGIGGCLRPVTD